MHVICIELIGLYVRMFIPSVNEHCGHYFIVIALFGQATVYYLIPFFLDCIVLAPYALQVFSSYNDHIVLLCFTRFLFICFKSYTDSRVRCE